MKNMKAQIVLTPSESKRLIAKAIVKLEDFKKAFDSGLIILSRSTTAAFIIEELYNTLVDKEKYACGIVTPYGTCETDPRFRIKKPIIIEKGELSGQASFIDTLKRMDNADVFVKSGNAIDPWGNAGVFIGDLHGGEIGVALNFIVKKNIKLIIPVGLEKSIPISITDAAMASSLKTEYSMGMPVRILPLHGRVITEKEAIEILANNRVKVTPIGAGGVAGAEGSVVLIIDGEKEGVQMAFQAVKKVKGERPLWPLKMHCSRCIHSETCTSRDK